MAERSPARPGPPLVSVIALCYNHARFVVECLDSIRTQTFDNVQLIIIDDCSQDGSPALIDDWIRSHDVDCTFLAHGTNVGVCRSLNEALRHVRGSYVATVATDDLWLPDKLERQIEAMERLPSSVGILYSDAAVIDEDGDLLKESLLRSYGRTRPPAGTIFEELLEQNFVPAMTTLVRRDCLEAVGPYDESLVFEDWDMWLRIARAYDFAYSPHPSARYRLLDTSLSRNLGARGLESLLKINLKCLGLSASCDRIVKARIPELAAALYRLDHDASPAYLRLALRHQRTLRLLALYCLARLGVRHATLHVLRARLRRLLAPKRSYAAATEEAR